MSLRIMDIVNMPELQTRLIGGEAGQEQGGEEDGADHAAAGSTSIRPFISMCMA